MILLKVGPAWFNGYVFLACGPCVTTVAQVRISIARDIENCLLETIIFLTNKWKGYIVFILVLLILPKR